MGYELDVMHPAVADWLESQNLLYVHEKRISAGRIDFLFGKLADTVVTIWIIECKQSYRDYTKGIMQLLLYGRVAECEGTPTKYILAFPKSEVAKLSNAQLACLDKMKIDLLPLDCETIEAYHQNRLLGNQIPKRIYKSVKYRDLRRSR